MEGKLIVLEGVDASGKNTQINLLREKLERENVPFKSIDFPRHGQPSAYFVDKYLDDLNSPYGDADELDPYIASVFFSMDRCDAGFGIRRWLKNGFIVIADRYTGSNIGHQGGKIKDEKEREKYIDWLMSLEFEILKVPKPDLNIVILAPIDVIVRRIRERHGGNDSHEANTEHLKRAQESYVWAAKKYPDYYKIVDGADKNGIEFTKEQVHGMVWNIVKGAL
jgi:dTMP kinase